MSQPENPKESIGDTRNWEFKARSEVCDFFSEDPDKTSATEFFNRTNGLGSPEYYAEKRMKKQQEDKENALKNRRVSRNRLQSSQKEPATKVMDEQEKLKQAEALKRRFSSLNVVSMPKRDSEVSNARKPVAVMKTNAVSAPKARPVALPKVNTAPVQKVNPAPVSKIRSASSAIMQIARTSSPTPAPRLPVPKAKPALIPMKTKIASPARVPVSVPKVNPVSDQQPEGPMTRSREATRRRCSFMMPTQASMRRSVQFK